MGYGLLRTYGLWCRNTRPPSWWMRKAMGYKQGGTRIKMPDRGPVGWLGCQAANFFFGPTTCSALKWFSCCSDSFEGLLGWLKQCILAISTHGKATDLKMLSVDK